MAFRHNIIDANCELGNWERENLRGPERKANAQEINKKNFCLMKRQPDRGESNDHNTGYV